MMRASKSRMEFCRSPSDVELSPGKCYDAGEDVVELVAGEGLVFLDFAVAERPIHLPRNALPRFGVFQFFLRRSFGGFVRGGSNFVLVDEGADFAAGVFERVA